MRRALALLLLSTLPVSLVPAQDSRESDRRRMLAEISAMARETGAETGRASFRPEVLSAMGRVPRHRFVPKALESLAYENQPLAIGAGQTISQPYIVALMTELLDARASDRVLEIGTGSGYQAAVLAELVAQVYTVEIVRSLGEEAQRRLASLGYRNVSTRVGDGYLGWPEEAPFDRIIVTAAAPEIPETLVAQLKAGGRMVIPVGHASEVQDLVVLDKHADASTTRQRRLPVSFVPITRGKAR